jgi:DNA mismatch repair protein MLH3
LVHNVVFMASMSTIRPLPADVASQIKSSASITSLNGVVIELLKNSLDACASKIEIGVEYGRGACTIEDDGLGIPSNEFKEGGGLGKLHCKSFGPLRRKIL